MFGPAMQATSLHRPQEARHQPLPRELPIKSGKPFQGMLPDQFGGFDQAAVGVLPGSHHQEPMLNEHGDHFGIHLT